MGVRLAYQFSGHPAFFPSLGTSPTSSSLLLMPPSALAFSPIASSNPHHLPPDTPFSSLSSSKAPNAPSSLKLSTRDKTHLSLPSEKPWLSTDGVKMPTAPWMRGPLLLPADQVLDLPKPRRKKAAGDTAGDPSLTEKVRGGRSRQAMRGVVRNIKRLREAHPEDAEGDAAGGAEAPEFSIPLEQVNDVEEGRRRRAKVPWAGVEEKVVFRREKKVREVTAAELTLPEEELRRLRGEAMRMKEWVKAKKAGVTQEVVDEIKRTWKKSELAMVKIVEPLRRNMDRAREIVETKTGGFVVWCKRDNLVVYRGSIYPQTPEAFENLGLSVQEAASFSKLNLGMCKDQSALLQTKSNETTYGSVIQKDGDKENHLLGGTNLKIQNGAESVNGTLYEREVSRLLDGLGPRFIDWWWRTPLPVDADLLPEVVPDFKPPFRLCPPGVRPQLSDDELTYLRKLARPLPTHFALGRNRRLQGLAAAIVKLWEKSLIAKVAVKVGIPNTNNQQMSWELKCLTGGVLILRNKFFIILYRGKDFLPGGVANSIFEREKELKDQQLTEEEARSNATKSFLVINELEPSTSSVGTFTEFQDLQANYISMSGACCEREIQIEAEKEKLEKEIRKQERELFILERKIEKSEKELAKLKSPWSPSEHAGDLELLTEEERQTFRKLGLKMDESLLLGRRGIYDGVIGNIHLHWKHREVVKVITMQNTFCEVTYTARLLEIESGGILVAVEKLRTGYAIIIYRGKNYRRPLKLLPDNLLTKREALRRSIEIQRRGSIKYFARQRQQSIWELKQKLRDLKRRTKDAIPN